MKGFIYKISSPHTDKIYIGSTILTLEERLKNHNKKSNQTNSRLILSYGDAVIECLEEVEYEDVDILRQKEGEYIRQYLDKCVNKIIIGRIHKEWVADNLENVKAYRAKYDKSSKRKAFVKQWWSDNQGKYNEKTRLRNGAKVKCDICGNEITKGNLSRHKKRSNCNSI